MKTVNDRIAIIPDKAEETAAGSDTILAADAYKDPPISGIIVDLPDDYDGPFKKYDRVWYPNYAPIELGLRNFYFKKHTTYHFIKPKEVFVHAEGSFEDEIDKS